MKGLAIATLVVGILALVGTVVSCGMGGIFLGLIGIILGVIATKKYKEFPDQEGRGMAKAGYIMSIIGFTVSIIMIIVMFAFCGGLAILGAGT